MTFFLSISVRRKSRPFPVKALFIAAIASVLLAGCATIPEQVLVTEPSAYLEKKPQVYLRLSGPALRDIAGSLGQEDLLTLSEMFSGRSDSKALQAGGDQASDQNPDNSMDTSTLKSFFAKTRTFGAGFGGLGTIRPDMEAVFIGDFQVLSVRLALAVNGEWERKDDGGYGSAKYPLFIRPPEPGVIHVSTSESAAATAGSLLADVFPRRVAGLSGSEIFLSINSPSSLLANSIQRDAMELPIDAIVITGRQAGLSVQTPRAGQDARYLLDVYILMNDETTARAYKPIVRFLWTTAADRFFGGVPGISSSQLVLEKDIYVARNIEVGASTFKAMLTSSLAGR